GIAVVGAQQAVGEAVEGADPHAAGAHRQHRAGWRGALRVQLALSFALVPLLLAQFQSVPLLSPLANLIAVPLVSFIVTPLVLLATPWPGPQLLPADLAAGLMMDFLNPLAALEFAVIERAAPPTWLFGGALAAVAMLLLPRASP